jgi:hypothetical protein
MSFLDNLENNLKAMESREEKDPARVQEERATREAEKQAALRAAPFAEALKKGPFVDGLLTTCRVVGHQRRVMVRPTWIGTTLRLDAGERRLELRPTAEGVRAVFLQGAVEQSSELVDLSADAGPLVERWLA